jgi:large subunit ribosomal protein L25
VADISLNAEKRTEFGKGAARRIRRDHKIPAVVYGHGTAPAHIALPGHETMLALKNANALMTITVDGEEILALAKDVQRDPVRQVIEHVDLVLVRRGEKVQVEIGVHLVGEAAAETVVTVESQTLLVEAEATHIPENVEVSVEGATAGTQVHASDVRLPPGTTLVTDPEILVVNVSQARTAEDVDAELAEAEADLGIEHEVSDEEKAAEPGGEQATGDDALSSGDGDAENG